VNRLTVVIDDYALAAIPGLDLQLAHAGAMVMRSFRGLPNPQLLRRLPDCDGAAVVSGTDLWGLVSRLERATATLSAPVIAVLPRGVQQSSELRGPGVVDLIPAGTLRAAERVVLMARVPIVSSGRGFTARKEQPPQAKVGPEPAGPRASPTSGSALGPLEARAQADARIAPRAVPARTADGAPETSLPPERIVGVASSTGGVWILASLLKAMTGTRDQAVLVAQHMESEFVDFFADWLGSVSGWKTVLVDSATPIESGRAYLAVGGRDLCVEGGQVVSAAPSSRYVPCADRLLRTLGTCFGPRSTGVVLSGMGSDGAEGLAELARRGGAAICQTPETAIVPSMPESALRRARGAIAVLPDQLAAALRNQ
jgi:chemotaxis response regulator CheB